MFFTWMVAAQMWMDGDPAADPFRMAEETAKIFNLPGRNCSDAAVPKDKKLVA